MPTRLWGDAQRARYGRFPEVVDEDDITRCFHLDDHDQTIITELRGAHNRLGFAVQLGAVRFIGTFPAQTPAVPPVVLDVLARQLAETPAASLDDYWSGRQRWRHVALIKDRYRFRDFTDAPCERFRLTRWLYALCWAGDDQPGLLMERAVAWLLARQVLLPGVSTLERFCARIRTRVQERRWHKMAGAFDAMQSAHIARLLDSRDGPASIEELRRAPRRLAPGEFMVHLQRIDAIRAVNLSPKGAPGSPDAVIERLARSARKMRPAALARLPEPRRSALLAALFGALEGIATGASARSSGPFASSSSTPRATASSGSATSSAAGRILTKPSCGSRPASPPSSWAITSARCCTGSTRSAAPRRRIARAGCGAYRTRSAAVGAPRLPACRSR